MAGGRLGVGAQGRVGALGLGKPWDAWEGLGRMGGLGHLGAGTRDLGVTIG